MNETELKVLWQSTSKQLEDNLIVNRQATRDITRLQVQGFLSSMKPIKIFTLVAGILWVIALGSLLGYLIANYNGEVSLFFLFSAGLQVILTAIAAVVYIYQINLIHNIDFSEPVIAIQEKLSRLKISTLNATRILFLQLPLWTTFYWNKAMFTPENLFWWILQGVVTICFTCLAIWLFFNIRYENNHKKWFQWIFRGKEWQPIMQSVELLNQIEDCKTSASIK